MSVKRYGTEQIKILHFNWYNSLTYVKSSSLVESYVCFLYVQDLALPHEMLALGFLGLTFFQCFQLRPYHRYSCSSHLG